MDKLQEAISMMVAQNMTAITDAIVENILDELCELARQQVISAYPLCELSVDELKGRMLKQMKAQD